MVPIGETFLTAMARESWEEAGIEEGTLQFHFLERHLISRAVTEGWMFEHTIMFDADVSDNFVPHNVDGEVEKFELFNTRRSDSKRAAIGAFTFESSLSVLLSIANKNGLSADLISYTNHLFLKGIGVLTKKSPRHSYLDRPQASRNLICKVLSDQHLVFLGSSS